MTFIMTNMTSRQKILAYLSQHSGATALEISRALRLTAANIRYHLAILVSEERVQVLGFRSDLGRGRPVQVYGPSETALGDNLTRLVETLFAWVLENNSSMGGDTTLELLAKKLINFQEGEIAGPLTRRLARIIARLNQYGYSARWEAHAIAPQVIFEHCPYSTIVDAYPEICRIDAIILRQCLGGQIEHTARLEKTSRGTKFCQFSVKN